MKKNLFKKNLFVLILVLSVVFPSSAAAQMATKANSPAMKAAENITAAQLKDYLYFVASDEMEGRDTPSRGLDTTAKFMATLLSRWGFKPAGDNGTFFQKIALTRDLIDTENNKLEVGDQKFMFGEDFFRLGGNGTTNAPLVFAKDGWFVKSKNIDALNGVDAKGKVLVIYSTGFNRNTLTPFPKGITPADIAGEKGVDWADPMTYDKQKGAVGIILVSSPELQQNWEQFRGFLSRGGLYPEKLRESGAGKALPTLLVSTKVGEAILRANRETRVQ